MADLRPSSPRSADPRFEVLAADIAARLRHVCAHLSDAEFATLVRDVVETKLRWAARYGEEPTAGPMGGVHGDECE